MGGRNYLRACASIIRTHHNIGATAPVYLHKNRETTATAPQGDQDLVPRAYSRARRDVWASLGIQADSSTRSRRKDRAEKGGGEGASAGEGDGGGKAAGGTARASEGRGTEDRRGGTEGGGAGAGDGGEEGRSGGGAAGKEGRPKRHGTRGAKGTRDGAKAQARESAARRTGRTERTSGKRRVSEVSMRLASIQSIGPTHEVTSPMPSQYPVKFAQPKAFSSIVSHTIKHHSPIV